LNEAEAACLVSEASLTLRNAAEFARIQVFRWNGHPNSGEFRYKMLL
jgi:hypothetical protein